MGRSALLSNSANRPTGKLYERVAFVTVFDRSLDFFQRLRRIQFRAVHDAVHLLDAGARAFIQPVSAQAHRIGSATFNRIPLKNHEGRGIFCNAGHPGDERHGPEHAFLVNAGQSADDDFVFHVDMAGKRNAIGHEHLVAHMAIVGDVAARHKKATVANGRNPVIVFFARHRARANRHRLPDHVIVTNRGPADEALAMLEVLRQYPYLRAAENAVVLANNGAPFDDAMRTDDGAFTNRDVAPNDRVRLDLNIASELSIRVDDSGRVYLHTLVGPN